MLLGLEVVSRLDWSSGLRTVVSILCRVSGVWTWQALIIMVSVDVHDDVINWKLFPLFWPFVRRIHRWPMNSPHKDQWRGALMFSLIFAWTNRWVNNRDAGDLRRHRAHYDVTVMDYHCVCRCFYAPSVLWYLMFTCVYTFTYSFIRENSSLILRDGMQSFAKRAMFSTASHISGNININLIRR